MFTLGISCYYHDSAAAVLKDGTVLAAVEEERFSTESSNRFLYCRSQALANKFIGDRYLLKLHKLGPY